MGQKGTVLLKLFLAEGDYPLIVDQPEDNLDNRTIYELLCQMIKEKKKDRQCHRSMYRELAKNLENN